MTGRRHWLAVLGTLVTVVEAGSAAEARTAAADRFAKGGVRTSKPDLVTVRRASAADVERFREVVAQTKPTVTS